MLPILLSACGTSSPTAPIDPVGTPPVAVPAVDTGTVALAVGDPECVPTPVGADPAMDDLRERSAALLDIPVGACGALLDPLQLTDVGRQVPELWELVRGDEEWSGWSWEGGVCPCVPVGATDWTYDCETTDGWKLVGYTEASFGGAGGQTRYDRFGAVRTDATGTWRIVTDGSRSSSMASTGLQLREERSNEGAGDDGHNGILIRQTHVHVDDGHTNTTGGGSYVYRAASSNPADDGDVCVFADFDHGVGCSEPTGTMEVTGAQHVVLTFDGDVACDGCAAVTIDGVAAEPSCGW